MNPEFEDGLVRYLANRDQQRADHVDRTLATLTARERHLVREAAVMGFVRGQMSAGGFRQKPPPDSEIVFEVVDACLSFEDLYPLIAAAGEGRRPRKVSR